MRAVTNIILAFCLWTASAAATLQVDQLKLAAYNTSFDYYTIRSGILAGDSLFQTCDHYAGIYSTLYVRNSDGTYKIIRNFLENLKEGNTYCADQPDSLNMRGGTNGKLFYHTRESSIPDNTFTVFFTLDENNQPANLKVMPQLTFSKFNTFLGENGMYGYLKPNSNSATSIALVEFNNGDWTYTVINQTLPTEISTGTCGSLLVNPTSDNSTLQSIVCLQPDKTWSLVAQVAFNDWVDYEQPSKVRRTYNKNDIVTFGSNSDTESTGGTLYLATMDGTKVASFDLWDFGIDPTYYTEVGEVWIGSPQWVNKDLAVMLVSNLPTSYNLNSGAKTSGSVAILSRDENGEWKLGGKLQFDDTLPDVVADTLQIAKSDILVVAHDGIYGGSDNRRLKPATNYLYSYPLCFKDQLSMTCKQNIQLTSCDQNNPPDLTDAYTYVDDGCGKPVASIQSVSFTDVSGSAVMRFERLGVKVGQCTATFTCPSTPAMNGPNNGPRSSSVNNGVVVQYSAIALLASTFVALM